MRSLKNSLYLLTLAISVFLFSCTSQPKEEASSLVKHFRHLQFSETPYDLTKGIYPLTTAEAATINNYTFTYNEDGKPASIAYMRGDQLLGYSSMGYAKVEITYTDSSEVHYFFNKDNEAINFRRVFSYVYQLDKSGNRIGLSFRDKEGNTVENNNSIAYYTWNVLPDEMVQEKRYNLKDEEVVMNPNCPFYELRFSYDENGYCTRMANYMGDTLYNCTAENCGEIGVSYFTFEHNALGGLTKFEVYNVNGQMSNLYSGWSKFENTLDENGYVVESFFWDQDNEPLGGRRNPLTLTSYDKHGAVTERQYMDKDRKLVIRQGINAAVVKYTYNEKGLPSDTIMLDVALAQIVK